MLSYLVWALFSHTHVLFPPCLRALQINVMFQNRSISVPVTSVSNALMTEVEWKDSQLNITVGQAGGYAKKKAIINKTVVTEGGVAMGPVTAKRCEACLLRRVVLWLSLIHI